MAGGLLLNLFPPVFESMRYAAHVHAVFPMMVSPTCASWFSLISSRAAQFHSAFSPVAFGLGKLTPGDSVSDGPLLSVGDGTWTGEGPVRLRQSCSSADGGTIATPSICSFCQPRFRFRSTLVQMFYVVVLPLILGALLRPSFSVKPRSRYSTSGSSRPLPVFQPSPFLRSSSSL